MTVQTVQLLDRYGPEQCPAMSVNEARKWCRKLARSHYENFTVLSALVPKELRDDFAAVYAFCRWADDLGDEAGGPERSLELLAWWRRELAGCFEGEPRHPVFVALEPVVREHELPMAPFDDLIKAFEQDQRVTRYATWDELLGYCRLSADPVGRLVLMLLGEPRDERLFRLSDAICTALQLTNHWQDIKRDALERDRIYVPAEMITIDRFEERLLASAKQGWAVDQEYLPAARTLVRSLVDRTWPLYDQGRRLLDEVGPRSRPVVGLLAAGGMHVLRLIQMWNFETVLHRPTLGRFTKGTLVAKAWWASRVGRGAPGEGRGSERAGVTDGTYTPDEALRWCREVTRRRARNFYYGLKLLPAKQRSQLFAIYAWMRRADDVADGSSSSIGTTRADAMAELDALETATKNALDGNANGHDPALVGLESVARDVTLDPALFESVLDGQRDDLNGRTYESFEELREYCYRVASTVGLLCIEIWGYDDTRAPLLAIDRGIAFQLTNILRDYVEDFDAGRVYLPAEDFRRHGITPANLRAFDEPAACRAFLLEQVERAESYYERSSGLESMVLGSCRSTLWAMTAIYHRLLDRIREDPSQVVRGQRVRLSPFVKSTIAVKARWRARHAGVGGR